MADFRSRLRCFLNSYRSPALRWPFVANGMGFRKDLDGGIVIGFGWPAEHCSQLEIITLAPDADRVLQIEQRFIALLTLSMNVAAA
jgi:hypothetical protein